MDTAVAARTLMPMRCSELYTVTRDGKTFPIMTSIVGHDLVVDAR